MDEKDYKTADQNMRLGTKLSRSLLMNAKPARLSHQTDPPKGFAVGAYGFTDEMAGMTVHADPRKRLQVTTTAGRPLYTAHNMPHLRGPRAERRRWGRRRGATLTKKSKARRSRGTVSIPPERMGRRIRYGHKRRAYLALAFSRRMR